MPLQWAGLLKKLSGNALFSYLINIVNLTFLQIFLRRWYSFSDHQVIVITPGKKKTQGTKE